MSLHLRCRGCMYHCCIDILASHVEVFSFSEGFHGMLLIRLISSWWWQGLRSKGVKHADERPYEAPHDARGDSSRKASSWY